MIGPVADAPRFYFAAMSPYSWLAAERIGTVLPQATWVPVTAAFVFKANGRTSWGLTEQRERGIAESEQRARAYGLGPIHWPDPWPASDIPVARAMTFAASIDRLAPYALGCMRLAFLEGRGLEQTETLRDAADRCGIDADELTAALARDEIKQALRDETDAAVALGVFGVPTVIVEGELFWGDDRLQDAAVAHRRALSG